MALSPLLLCLHSNLPFFLRASFNYAFFEWNVDDYYALRGNGFRRSEVFLVVFRAYKWVV